MEHSESVKGNKMSLTEMGGDILFPPLFVSERNKIVHHYNPDESLASKVEIIEQMWRWIKVRCCIIDNKVTASYLFIN